MSGGGVATTNREDEEGGSIPLPPCKIRSRLSIASSPPASCRTKRSTASCKNSLDSRLAADPKRGEARRGEARRLPRASKGWDSTGELSFFLPLTLWEIGKNRFLSIHVSLDRRRKGERNRRSDRSVFLSSIEEENFLFRSNAWSGFGGRVERNSVARVTH